jgi:chemotaxis signal transduction protein
VRPPILESGPRPALGGVALELRREFDGTFAAPPPEPQPTEDLLGVRVAGEPYALRVSEIDGVESCPKLVPLPTRVPELLGLAGIRGGLVAVYGLGPLLGPAAATEPVRWLILCGGGERVGLGLTHLEGWLRVARSALSAPVGASASGERACQVVRVGGAPRPVISIPSVLETLRARVASAGPVKEL